MRILFLSRASLFTNKGGDTTQILQTAEALKKLGIQVIVSTTDQVIDYKAFDLIHFFNIIRPADILYHVNKSKLPFVVSTIYVDYSLLVEPGIKTILFKILGKNKVEYLKTIARYFFNGEKIGWKPYLWKGQQKSIKLILQKASCLLPNSESEFLRLKADYPSAQNYVVVPNGVNLTMFDQSKFQHIKRISNKILCVARFEPMKNQLRLIQALNDKEFELFLIGKPSTNQLKYYEECRTIASSNIHFIEGLTQEELLPHYASAKVHVLPSWFETTGLSSLEAAAMGCSIVVTDKGDTKDYFKDDAFYCDPSNVDDMYAVIQKAAFSEASESLEHRIKSIYQWDNTAAVTLKVYKHIISGKL